MSEEKKQAEGAAEQAAPEAVETAEAAEAEVIEEVEGEAVADEAADQEAAEGEEAAEEEPVDEAQVQLAIAQAALVAAQGEAKDIRDKYARLQAEWDNFRKRTAAERESERVRAAEKLVTDLLPVLDDLERAINHARESGDGGSLTDGVDAILNKTLTILGKHKVSQVPAMNEPFDAMKHQAVGTQEDESVPDETVVQVYQQGYQMGDRVIRPAMVVTSTGGPMRTAEDAESEDE